MAELSSLFVGEGGGETDCRKMRALPSCTKTNSRGKAKRRGAEEVMGLMKMSNFEIRWTCSRWKIRRGERFRSKSHSAGLSESARGIFSAGRVCSLFVVHVVEDLHDRAFTPQTVTSPSHILTAEPGGSAREVCHATMTGDLECDTELTLLLGVAIGTEAAHEKSSILVHPSQEPEVYGVGT
jgi:hypothetical protein